MNHGDDHALGRFAAFAARDDQHEITRKRPFELSAGNEIFDAAFLGLCKAEGARDTRDHRAEHPCICRADKAALALCNFALSEQLLARALIGDLALAPAFGGKVAAGDGSAVCLFQKDADDICIVLYALGVDRDRRLFLADELGLGTVCRCALCGRAVFFCVSPFCHLFSLHI